VVLDDGGIDWRWELGGAGGNGAQRWSTGGSSNGSGARGYYPFYKRPMLRQEESNALEGVRRRRLHGTPHGSGEDGAVGVQRARSKEKGATKGTRTRVVCTFPESFAVGSTQTPRRGECGCRSAGQAPA
jgi:hypothetical protein